MKGEQMYQARSDISKLIQFVIEKTKDFDNFNKSFLEKLLHLLDIYKERTFDARDPEVLYLFASLISY